MGPFTQQIGNQGIWSVGQRANTPKSEFFKSDKATRAGQAAEQRKVRGAECKTPEQSSSLRPSQDDESNYSIPCALALWKYVDKRA